MEDHRAPVVTPQFPKKTRVVVCVPKKSTHITIE
jgi:hypothetical protein